MTSDYKVIFLIDKLLTNKFNINNLFEQNDSIITLYLGNIKDITAGILNTS